MTESAARIWCLESYPMVNRVPLSICPTDGSGWVGEDAVNLDKDPKQYETVRRLVDEHNDLVEAYRELKESI